MPNCHKNKCGCQKDKDDCNWGNEICKIKHKLCEIKKCLACGCSMPIYNKDLPLVISQPGCYCIAEDLIFNPPFNPIAPVTPTPPYNHLTPTTVQAAITVLSSNVQIKFGCHYLKQFVPADPKTQVPYVVGIVIPDIIPNDPVDAVGLESIYITGDQGIIADFSLMGIRAFAHIQDIQIEGITIKDTATLASLAGRPPASATYGFEYLPHSPNPNFGPSFNVGGLLIGEGTRSGMGPVWFADTPILTRVNVTKEVLIRNVNCLKNFSRGMELSVITDMIFQNNRSDFSWSDDPGRSTAPAYNGILPFSAQISRALGIGTAGGTNNSIFSDSTFNSTQYPPPGSAGEFTTPVVGAGNLMLGVNALVENNISYINCQSSGHSCTFPTNDTACGWVGNAPQNTTWENCNFDNITSMGSIQAMHISGVAFTDTIKPSNGLILRGCTARGNVSFATLRIPGSLIANKVIHGFLNTFGKNCLYDNCVAQNNVVYSPNISVNSACSGFNASPAGNDPNFPAAQDATMSNIIYRGCVATGNITTAGGSANGFFSSNSGTDAIKSSIYENCISTGNQALSPGLPPPWINPSVGAPFPPSYNIGQTVQYGNQNYISLINSNVDTPNAGPGLTSWAVTLPNTLPWNPLTPYVPNSTVTFSPAVGTPALSYAALRNSTGAPPNTSPLDWVQLVVNPATWNPAITYSIGQQVYWLGYNYFSEINSNLGAQPDLQEAAWSLYPGRAVLAKPTYVIHDWNGAVPYVIGSYVVAAGIIYVSRTGTTLLPNQGNRPDLDANLTNWTPYASGTGSVFQAVAQGGGFGFVQIDTTVTTPEKLVSFPSTYTNCQALHNKGLPRFNSSTAALNPRYSAGYSLQNDVRSLVNNCIAEDNIYGFFLKNCNREVLRGNNSDNNIDLQFMLSNPGGLPKFGEGYTDVGTGTPAVPTASTSLFESNRAFANGSVPHVGENSNYNIKYGVGLVPLQTLNGDLTVPANVVPTSAVFQPTVNVSMVV